MIYGIKHGRLDPASHLNEETHAFLSFSSTILMRDALECILQSLRTMAVHLSSKLYKYKKRILNHNSLIRTKSHTLTIGISVRVKASSLPNSSNAPTDD